MPIVRMMVDCYAEVMSKARAKIVVHWRRGLREFLAADAAEVLADIAVVLAERAVHARVPIRRILFCTAVSDFAD